MTLLVNTKGREQMAKNFVTWIVRTSKYTTLYAGSDGWTGYQAGVIFRMFKGAMPAILPSDMSVYDTDLLGELQCNVGYKLDDHIVGVIDIAYNNNADQSGTIGWVHIKNAAAATAPLWGTDSVGLENSGAVFQFQSLSLTAGQPINMVGFSFKFL